jgi:hypothetical protein
MKEEIAAVEAEIAQFEKERDECLASIRALRDEEDPAAGVFRNVEIHAAQQEKLRLDFEIQFRKNKIKRIRYTG